MNVQERISAASDVLSAKRVYGEPMRRTGSL